MPYSPLLIRPFREELTQAGVQELQTPEQVDDMMKQTGVTMIVVNSVCGCAAGSARPGHRPAQEQSKKPHRSAALIAGPSIALFKDQELVYFIPKHRIEGRDADSLANDLKAIFDEYC
jgi:hypothetical protein